MRFRQSIAAGQRVFGENRVQEAKGKWPALISGNEGIVLHLIGPLQSNKAKEAVALFDAIHSVDRPSICRGVSQGNRIPEQASPAVRPDQHRRGAAEGPASYRAEADAFLATCRDTLRPERFPA